MIDYGSASPSPSSFPRPYAMDSDAETEEGRHAQARRSTRHGLGAKTLPNLANS